MTVKAKTVMRGRGQRAAFTIQIVTPVVDALHVFRKGQITIPEKLLCCAGNSRLITLQKKLHCVYAVNVLCSRVPSTSRRWAILMKRKLLIQ